MGLGTYESPAARRLREQAKFRTRATETLNRMREAEEQRQFQVQVRRDTEKQRFRQMAEQRMNEVAAVQEQREMQRQAARETEKAKFRQMVGAHMTGLLGDGKPVETRPRNEAPPPLQAPTEAEYEAHRERVRTADSGGVLNAIPDIVTRTQEAGSLVGGRAIKALAPSMTGVQPAGLAINKLAGREVINVDPRTSVEEARKLPEDVRSAGSSLIGNDRDREVVQQRLTELGVGYQIAGAFVLDPLNLIPGLGIGPADVSVALRAIKAGGKALQSSPEARSLVSGLRRLADEETGAVRLGREANESAEAATEAVEDTRPLWEQAAEEVTTVLQSSRKNIARTAIERSVERGQRFENYDEAYQALRAEGMDANAAHRQAMQEMAGPYTPVEGAGFQNLTEPKRQAMWDRVDEVDLRQGERLRARVALGKITAAEPLQLNEVNLLERIYGKPFANALRKAGKQEGGLLQLAYELAVMPKAVLSSFDMSYPLRQGIMMAPGHPKEFAASFKPMIKAALSDNNALAIERGILEDATPVLVKMPNGQAQQMKLGKIIEQVGLTRSLDSTMETGEEAFRGSLAQRLPFGIGKIVRGSNRAFTTFGNKFRADTFRTIVDKWTRQGVEITPERLQDLSNMLNRFTGRGTLGDQKLGGRVTALMQATWWAPQYRVSGPQAFAQLVHRDGAIRAEAWRNAAAFVGTGLSLLTAAKLSGIADVNVDPRSTDFGKARFGDTRLNVWGTNQLLARTIAQIVTGERIDPNLGAVPGDRLGAGVRYFRSGLAPEWGLLWDMATGEDFLGNPLRFDAETAGRLAKEQLLPLVVQDAIEAFQAEGLVGLATVPGVFFGAHVSTYEPSVSQQLGAIPEFTGLTPRQVYDIDEFQGRVDEQMRTWRAQYGPPSEGFSRADAVRYIGQQEGLNPNFIEWAVLLSHGTRSRADLRNPEWVQFIVEHYDELKDRKDHLYDRNYIIDAAREAGVEVR